MANFSPTMARRVENRPPAAQICAAELPPGPRDAAFESRVAGYGRRRQSASAWPYKQNPTAWPGWIDPHCTTFSLR